jgi:hypothetical protein
MSIILNGTTGITTPDVTADSGESLTSRVAKSGDTMTGVLTIQNAGFDSRITLQNTGTGGQTFNVFSTMDSFTQGGGNLLFHTSSAPNGILKMDFAGRVTMPYQPSFYADVSSTTTFQGDVSNAVGIFNRATVNIGNHYSTATGKFTAPVAGTYVFSVGAACSANITQFWFVVNGNRSESFLVAAAGAQNSILSASGMMRLQAGDSLGVLPYTGTANVSLSSSSLHTFFRGHLIG